MKKTLAVVFAAALVLIPAWGLARTYEAPYLSCVSSYPVVSAGNAGRFHVVSNVDGPFMWVAVDEEYGVPYAGPEFVAPFMHTGSQQVSVVWGSKRASCYVDVIQAPGFGESYYAPAFGYGDIYNDTYGVGPNVTLTSMIYPRLPNAGFAPQTIASFAFAFVLLLGAAIALYRHIKYAFTVVTR